MITKEKAEDKRKIKFNKGNLKPLDMKNFFNDEVNFLNLICWLLIIFILIYLFFLFIRI